MQEGVHSKMDIKALKFNRLGKHTLLLFILSGGKNGENFPEIYYAFLKLRLVTKTTN